MIIDPQFRKCVTFLFVDKVDEETGKTIRVACATAFYVSVPVVNNIFLTYLVTARHVIRRSRPYPFFVRVNTTDGAYIDLSASQDSWIEHPDTDIAVCPLQIPLGPPKTSIPDIKQISFSMLATSKFIEENHVREGDDIFFSGMFQGYSGTERMQPIIRFGNISLMPYEKIMIRDSPQDTPYPVNAYLVESRSWGGHSGSPTFLYLNPNRIPGEISFYSGRPDFVLFGLVSSHFELSQDIKFVGDILGKGSVDINAGIAVIIPAHFIAEILQSDECLEYRKQIMQKIKGIQPHK